MRSYHSTLPGEMAQKWNSKSFNLVSFFFPSLASNPNLINRRKNITLSFLFGTLLRQCAASNPLLLRFVIHVIQPLLFSSILLFFQLLVNHPYGFIPIGIFLLGVLIYFSFFNSRVNKEILPNSNINEDLEIETIPKIDYLKEEITSNQINYGKDLLIKHENIKNDNNDNNININTQNNTTNKDENKMNESDLNKHEQSPESTESNNNINNNNSNNNTNNNDTNEEKDDDYNNIIIPFLGSDFWDSKGSDSSGDIFEGIFSTSSDDSLEIPRITYIDPNISERRK